MRSSMGRSIWLGPGIWRPRQQPPPRVCGLARLFEHCGTQFCGSGVTKSFWSMEHRGFVVTTSLALTNRSTFQCAESGAAFFVLAWTMRAKYVRRLYSLKKGRTRCGAGGRRRRFVGARAR